MSISFWFFNRKQIHRCIFCTILNTKKHLSFENFNNNKNGKIFAIVSCIPNSVRQSSYQMYSVWQFGCELVWLAQDLSPLWILKRIDWVTGKKKRKHAKEYVWPTGSQKKGPVHRREEEQKNEWMNWCLLKLKMLKMNGSGKCVANETV